MAIEEPRSNYEEETTGMLTNAEEANVAIGEEADRTLYDISQTPTATTSVYRGAGTEDQTAGALAQEQANIQEAERYYDTERGTVAGQLESLLSADSPYLKQAETRAKLATQRAGMLGSSMAVGAAEAARIKQALPIAQQDAQAYQRLVEKQQALEGAAGQLGAEGQVSADLKQMGADLANEQTKLSTSLNTMVKELDYKATNLSQEMMGNLTAEHELATQTALTNLQGSIESALAQQQIDAKQAENARILASDYLKSYQITVETLLSNADFTALGADAVTNTLNNILDQTVGAIQFTADSAGWEATPWINTLEEDLQWATTIEQPVVTEEV